MQIKTFRGRTLREALAQVRAELGPGAAVLHTREVAVGRLTKLWRSPIVEVAATADASPLAEQAARSGVVSPGSRRVAEALGGLGQQVRHLRQRRSAPRLTEVA